MEQIRKGNDIKVYWEIITGGDGSEIPYELEGKALELYAQNAYEKVRISDFVANGNVIEWSFYGKDQKTAGVYSLTLIENNGSEGMRTVDECNAFELVTHSCKTGGNAESRVSIETVRLRSVMTLSDVVPDKELNKNSTNVVENGAIAREFEKQNGAIAKKQDIIPDLAIIREGANKGATALQEHQDISGKANTTGRYPDMSVGFADDLVGRGESVPAEFSFRASGGKSIKDGTARIKRLKGNSVVWNQWAKPFEEAYEKPYHDGITYNGNKVTVANWKAYIPFRFDIKCSTAKDHLYLVLLNYANTNPDQLIYIEFGGENSINRKIGNIAYFHRNIIYNNAYKDTFTLYLANTLEGTVTLSDLQVIDLTLMFGAGNEPTTIEEYNARKPIVADEYAYNEGEVIHMTAEGIKSVGDNAWDEEWELGFIDPTNGNERSSQDTIRSKNFNKIIGGEKYVVLQDTGGDMQQDPNYVLVLYDEDKNFIDFWGIPEVYRELSIDSRARYFKVAFKVAYGTTYKNDVMISLMHSGWKQDTDAGYQPYWEDRLMFDQRIKDEFPDGMSRWDMVYNKNGKGHSLKGMSVVDLGSLNWEKGWYNEAGDWRIYAEFRHKAIGLSNMINCIYPNANKGDAEMADKTITGHNNPDLPYIYIRDSSYSAEGADALIASLQGVPLYYQLAEPTIIEYDEPFNLDYRVADFGTEEIIAEQPSAPISADIIYQFNAVDMIREHELEITELQRIIATMQAQLTSLTSNNGGQ